MQIAVTELIAEGHICSLFYFCLLLIVIHTDNVLNRAIRNFLCI